MHVLSELADLLPPFLLQQRWFGGKARTLTSCAVDDVADLHTQSGAAVVVARVGYDDASPERYALLVTRHDDPHPLPTIGRLPGTGQWAFEAVAHESTVRELLGGFARGTIPTAAGGRLEYADLTETARTLLADPEVPIRLLGAEQSNTSIRIGRTLVFKLFRKLEAGENPELEVGRFLSTRTTFRDTPQLHGSLSYTSPAGEVSTLGVLQAWVDNLGDGWTYALKQLGNCAHVDSAALQSDLGRLGEVTARFHAAAASDPSVPDFAPEALDAADVRSWQTQVLQEAHDTFDLLRRQVESWTGDTQALGRQVLSRAAHAGRLTGAVESGPESFRKIRIHGDYHLGQTLKTASGFVMIDFEGEPARPLAIRRSKQCALKDVAGMLRSVDYAVDTACAGHVDIEHERRIGAMLRHAFVNRYVETALLEHATAIPTDPAAVDRWIAFFEFEKALYELRYEINNRPGWVRIPLRAVLRALEGAAPRPDAR